MDVKTLHSVFSHALSFREDTQCLASLFLKFWDSKLRPKSPLQSNSVYLDFSKIDI